MASSGKPLIGIFVNKQVPWSDYRVATALALGDAATFEFAFPGTCTSRIAKHFRCNRVDFGEGVDLFGDLKGLIQMWRVLRARRFDIVHFFSTKYILLGPLVARLAGVKRIVLTVTGLGRTFSSQSALMRPLRHLYMALFRVSLKLSGAVLFQNKDDLEVFARQCPWGDSKYAVVGSSMTLEPEIVGVEDAGRGLLPIEANDELRLVTVARIFEDKGIREFLEVARRLKEAHQRPLTFMLIGPPSAGRSALHQEVKSAHESGAIRYLGERFDVVSLLRVCDIFVFCSYREGIPRALLEAHGCGLPSVAFDVPGCRDVVVDGVTGFLTPSRNVEVMTERIDALIRDPRLREKLGKAARRRFQKEYSMERFAQRMALVYDLKNVPLNPGQAP